MYGSLIREIITIGQKTSASNCFILKHKTFLQYKGSMPDLDKSPNIRNTKFDFFHVPLQDWNWEKKITLFSFIVNKIY